MKEKKVQKLIKRVFDIVASLLVLVSFLPVWVIVALFIKITSTGPIFFLQDRPGLNKRFLKYTNFER